MDIKNKVKLGDHLVFFIALFILGFIFALAIKAQITASIEEQNDHNDDLISIIKEMEFENSTLENSIASIMKQSDELRLSGDYGLESLNELTERNQELKEAAGMTEVAGAGIEVILNDSSETERNDYDKEAYIVHDKNLLYLVNDLRPHCEAIAINGQRVIAMSDIRCVGTVILVNQTRLAPPYRIEIIGDQKEILTALENSTEYKSIINSPLELELSKQEALTVPAYKGIYEFSYATCVEEETTTEETTDE